MRAKWHIDCLIQAGHRECQVRHPTWQPAPLLPQARPSFCPRGRCWLLCKPRGHARASVGRADARFALAAGVHGGADYARRQQRVSTCYVR